MGRIFSKLPAFAADYSGAQGVFYDLNAILITYDAGSCAGCYWILDEPRLFSETKNVFSASLREKDIVMGADEKIKSRVRKTYEELGGECVMMAGTPVPTIIGTDYKGIAREIESELGIPAFGIDSSGLEFYDVGQRKAYESLFEYCDRQRGETLADVNVIGATPIDMWDLNQIKDMISFLKLAGAEKPVVWGANGKLKEIAGASGAKLNIAVSESAISIVKKMKEKFGTPYIVGYPVGKMQTEIWKTQVHNILFDKDEMIENEVVPERDERVLIIGEQVASNALRDMLKYEYGYQVVDVISYFKMYKEYMREQDSFLVEESDFTELLTKREKYNIVIGDPLYFSLLPYQPEQTVFMPHTAVSSRAFWDKSPNIFGEKGSYYFDQMLKKQEEN